ncbi:MAG TPA: hypothetical protein VH186_35900 [Chloroflexia bacterium]|nr:hypothetical protein [Chloroflexia bacterium]
MANTFVLTRESGEMAELAFNHFMQTVLDEGARRFSDYESGIYMYCQLAPEDEAGRRVLVVSERYSQVVRVCIEAAYELFEGDVHHYVQRIGTVERETVSSNLEPLMRQAYNSLMAWKPTHENIWDNVY